MRHEIEAGTDAAALLLFDPDAIPASLDARSLDLGSEPLERLDRMGMICLIRPGGDGVYRIHVHVDEPIPSGLTEFVRSTKRIERFPIPSGRLRFAGLEYALREDNVLLRRHPHAGGAIAVRPGTYRLTLLRLVYPPRLLQGVFRAEAPVAEYLAWMSMKLLIPLAIAAWIGLVVIFFTKVRVPFPNSATAVLGLLFSLPFLARRLDAFAAARARFQGLEAEHPPLVASLESAEPVPSR